ncbi:MAG: L-histidine N(alpha)-methyltransferase [Dokdonella sp.]|uniref:L-histidine N(alpha)-methyltransferase n=1 Tax=Dokdonella sp. TaxID=2291710 RepID=UPI0032674156
MTKLELARQLVDPASVRSELLADVRRGFRTHPKRLSSKYFYDERGSQLFEDICEQPEYYLTRTELALMREHVDAIADTLGPEVLLVEYGSGSGLKTDLLLAALDRPVAYAPVEISLEALDASVRRLAERHRGIEMLPVCADFTRGVVSPRPKRAAARTVVYFPGSTLGNFDASDAVALMKQMRAQIGTRGAALIGIDLKKDPAIIEAAYNDAAGVTAAFTMNLLVRLNRELGADFDLARFRHSAVYNALAGRIETHIVSLDSQDVHIEGGTFHFERHEGMLVEYSCKYSIEDFGKLAAKAGLRMKRHWTDSLGQFAVVYLESIATD